MALGSITPYDSFITELGKGSFDLINDTFKVLLTTSTYSPSASLDTVLSDITNEVASGGGYTTGGITITPSWSGTGGVYTFDFADIQWTGTGAGFTAHYWVLYQDTGVAGTSNLMFYGLLDATPASVTVADTQNLNVVPNASGLFTIS